MSTISMMAGVVLAERLRAESFWRRGSGTVTMPVLGSMVQKG